MTFGSKVIWKSYEITPAPVRLPTVTGTVISDAAAAFWFGSETGIRGVPVGEAVGVAVNVGVALGLPVPPETVRLPFVVNAGGSPSLNWNPGWKMLPGSV